MKSATQEKGVEEEVRNPRADMLEEIAKKHANERREYSEQHGITLEETGEDPEKEPEKEEPEKEEPEKEDPEKPKTVRIKVDGQEREVEEDKVREAGIRALQKESAADSRLEKATKMLKQAEERLNELASKDPAQKAKTDLSQVDDRELARQLQMGTEDEAAEAVAALRDRKSVSTEDITAMVEARVFQRLEFEKIKSEYSDIFNDPLMTSLSVMEDERMVAAGDERPALERLPDIAKRLREWRGTSKPATPEKATVSDLSEKAKQKAQASVVDSAKGRTPAPAQPKPQTVAEKLEEMRRARGQA